MLPISEKLSVRAVRDLLGPRRGGRPLSAATFNRWHTIGLRGVLLRTALEGGSRFTTRAWLDEFFADVEAARQKDLAARRREGVRRAS